PNSVVKRICGEDSEGVAPCENSSVPGPLYPPSRLRSESGRFVLAYSFCSYPVSSLRTLSSLVVEYVRRIILTRQKA
ncbi:MAG: hypothetical protein ACFB14_12115, partial [Leptolyngbyaceae cyanobacterium]